MGTIKLSRKGRRALRAGLDGLDPYAELMMLVVEKAGGVIEVDNLDSICVDLTSTTATRAPSRPSAPARSSSGQKDTHHTPPPPPNDRGSKDRSARGHRERAEIAAARGLPATAKSWCDTYNAVKARPASEMILADDGEMRWVK